MRTVAVLIIAMLGALLAAGAADASWRYRTFQSPTGTSLCRIALDRSGKEKTFVRCDVSGATNARPKKPKSCEFDYGFSFGMNARGRSRINCVSDAIADPSKTKKLAYGASRRLGGITCNSRRTGMTCTNRSGHGFTLTRARQTLF